MKSVYDLRLEEMLEDAEVPSELLEELLPRLNSFVLPFAAALGGTEPQRHATEYITGIEREQLLGSDVFTYFTEPQMAGEVFQEVFAKGTVADPPLKLRLKAGKRTDLPYNAAAFKTDEGAGLWGGR